MPRTSDLFCSVPQKNGTRNSAVNPASAGQYAAATAQVALLTTQFFSGLGPQIKLSGMSLTSTQAAEVLYPTLSAFHAVQGHALKGVRQLFIDGSVEQLTFDFGSESLRARVDENDDTINISLLPCDQFTTDEQEVSDVRPWRELIGRSFGWGWLIMNQQGYIDGLLIGFDGIEPQILLNVIASSIKVGMRGQSTCYQTSRESETLPDTSFPDGSSGESRANTAGGSKIREQ